MVPDRKRQILEVTAELLEHKSFAAFSYQDLAERLEISKASVHHHFATKEQLGLALIGFYRANSERIMAEIMAGRTPGDAVRTMLEASESVLLDGSHVCPSAAFEVDAAGLTDSLRDAMKAFQTEFHTLLAGLLEAGRRGDELKFAGEPSDQAAMILAALQGARESSRILGREYFRGVVRQLGLSITK